MGDTMSSQEPMPTAQETFLAILMVGFTLGFVRGVAYVRENPDDTVQIENPLMPFDSEIQCGGFQDEPGKLMVTIRTFNCLRREGIHTIRELIRMCPEDILAIHNLDQKSVDEIIHRLKAYGYRLARS